MLASERGLVLRWGSLPCSPCLGFSGGGPSLQVLLGVLREAFPEPLLEDVHEKPLRMKAEGPAGPLSTHSLDLEVAFTATFKRSICTGSDGQHRPWKTSSL